MKIINLEDKITDDFNEYSSYVNNERAIAELYDGCKPVARRILYTMYKMKLLPDKQTKKCANIVGQTMAYHPHGDSGIYNALVRLTQDFSNKLPLINGQGNFGTLELPPASSRYTEAKLSAAGYSMVEKLNKGIVPMISNYDDSELEPEFLPVQFPVLLVNGSSGIGVGMAANIPSHNLTEVLDTVIALIENPALTTSDLLNTLQGPDFNSGCEVVNKNSFAEVYGKGKGAFKLRAKFSFKNNTLIISNFPFKTYASKIESQIYELQAQGELKEISQVINTTSKEEQLTLTLNKNFIAEELVQKLCWNTDCEKSFSMDFKAIEDNPRSFSLKDFLVSWIKIHKEINLRELVQDREVLEQKLEIVEGLIRATMMIDEIITLIKSSENRSEAKQKLIEKGFTEKQSNAILDIKLSRLTKLEAVELDKQKFDLETNLAGLNILIEDKSEFDKYLINKLNSWKKLDVGRKSLVSESQFTKIVKSKNDKFYISNYGTHIKIGEEVPKGKYLTGDSNNPIYIFAENNVIPVKNTKETIYTDFHGILNGTDVLHFSKDGYVKKTNAEDFKVSRKAKAVNQDVFTVLFANNGWAILTTKSGKQLQFNIDEVPYSKRGAKGVLAAKLNGEELSKIEIVSSPIKGIKKKRGAVLK